MFYEGQVKEWARRFSEINIVSAEILRTIADYTCGSTTMWFGCKRTEWMPIAGITPRMYDLNASALIAAGLIVRERHVLREVGTSILYHRLVADGEEVRKKNVFSRDNSIVWELGTHVALP